MKLTVHTFLTLDGTMQAPGAPDEDPSGGFAHGGWTVPLFDELSGAAVANWFSGADAFLLGRRTYEIFADYWPHVTDPEHPIATLLNAKPKYVASRTLRELDWDGAQVLGGDAIDAIRALKAQPGGELQVHGSADLVQTLLAHDLIDELRLITFPVLIGEGAKLFRAGTAPSTLRLTASTTSPGGNVISTYRFAGPLKRGTFGIVDGQDVVVGDGFGVEARQADSTG